VEQRLKQVLGLTQGFAVEGEHPLMSENHLTKLIL
jgi:hypothetical protein